MYLSYCQAWIVAMKSGGLVPAEAILWLRWSTRLLECMTYVALMYCIHDVAIESANILNTEHYQRLDILTS